MFVIRNLRVGKIKAPIASRPLKEFNDAWEDDLLTILLLRRYRRKRKLRELQRRMAKRRFWVRDIYLNSPTLGAYRTLFRELHADREYFFRYIRMSPDHFQHLLSLVAEDIIKDTTNFRIPVSPEKRLALTLRFLASGESQQSLCYSFRLGKSTVSKIVAETCSAIYSCLKGTYLTSPQSADERQNIALSFEEQWNFPRRIVRFLYDRTLVHFLSRARVARNVSNQLINRYGARSLRAFSTAAKHVPDFSRRLNSAFFF